MDPIYEQIFRKQVDRIHPTLDRMGQALQSLGMDPRGKPVLLIGGTNGKGSVAGHLWRLLSAQNIRAGLYTSPHLVDFRERYLTPDGLASRDEIVAAVEYLQTKLGPLYEALSFFEVATLIARLIFDNHQTDIDVLEVGLGGRWDATNAFHPIASAIVSIGIDHAEFLGNTHGEILKEKMGICRPDAPLFWGLTPTNDEYGPLTTWLLHHDQRILYKSVFQQGIDFKLDEERIMLRIPGLPPEEAPLPKRLVRSSQYIRTNFSLAAAMAIWTGNYLRRPRPRLTDLLDKSEASTLIEPPCLKGRFQEHTFSQSGHKIPLIIDAGHNPDGIRLLVQEIRNRYSRKIPAVLSILRDKDIHGILSHLSTVCYPMFLYQTRSPRTWRAEDLPLTLQDRLHGDFASCWQDFSRWHRQEHPAEPTLLCGSVYGIGEAMDNLSIIGSF